MIYIVELTSGTVFETKVSPDAIEAERQRGAITYLFPIDKTDKDLGRTVFIDHIVQMLEKR